MITKQFVGDRIELHAIDTFAFPADIDDAETRSHLPIEDLTAHAEVARRFTDAKNARQYGVLHGGLVLDQR